MKTKRIILTMIIGLSIITFIACNKDNENDQSSENNIDQNKEVKDNTTSNTSEDETKSDENNEDNNTTNQITKIEEKEKYIEKLDNIQKELDKLPIKKDVDAGVTNAMKSYYGKSYDLYDEALNAIYALLKDNLSPETMKKLKAEQIEWIEQKEALANEKAAEYKGGSFESVAYNKSLYGSTKERCYTLVNNYMID